MRYNILHETLYTYPDPVVVSHQLLHVSPRPLPWQTLHRHQTTIEPEPGERSERLDYFGNALTQFALVSRHTFLTVRAASEVSVDSRGGEAQAVGSQPWEAVRDLLRMPATGTEADTLIDATDYLYESPHAGPSRTLAEYARPSFPAGRPVHEGARDLTRRIKAEFEFDPAATTVSTPLDEVLKGRRGVCQDFAHLMIGALRSIGLGARYVSGYLRTHPPPGKPRMVGVDASHAWVSVFCPQRGWVDFDPTNDCVVDEAHITVAWGRDFSDVTPMRGVILGGAEQTLEVKVTVAPANEPPPVEPPRAEKASPGA